MLPENTPPQIAVARAHTHTHARTPMCPRTHAQAEAQATHYALNASKCYTLYTLGNCV